MNCDHKYVHLDTKKSKESRSFTNHYKRIVTFFCEKCLEEKTKIKEAFEREAPDWY